MKIKARFETNDEIARKSFEKNAHFFLERTRERYIYRSEVRLKKKGAFLFNTSGDFRQRFVIKFTSAN